MGMLLALLWTTTAHALPWYVPTAAEQQDLQEALDELWADAPIEVLVGEIPPGLDGLTREEDRLLLVANGRLYERHADADAAVEVTLARAWMREIELVDSGWVPERPDPPPEPDPPVPTIDPVVIVPPAEPPPPAVFSLGVGLREAFTEPGLGDGVRVLMRTDVGPIGIEGSALAAGLSVARTPGYEERIASLKDDKRYAATPADTAAFSLTADWHPIRGRSPRIVAGAERYRWRQRELVFSTDTGSYVIDQGKDDSGWRTGAVIGAGIEAGIEDFIVRATWYERFSRDVNEHQPYEQFVFLLDFVVEL